MRTAKSEQGLCTGPGRVVVFDAFTPSKTNVGGVPTTSIEKQFSHWANCWPNAQVAGLAPTSCSSDKGLHQTLVVHYYEPPPPTPADLELVALVADQERFSISRATRDVEVLLIRRALVKTGGRRTEASVLLGISHRALLYKIKEFGIT